MRAPIHSVKHYVQTSLSTVTGAAILTVVLARGAETANAPDEVKEGAVVKAMWVELWVIAQDTVPGSFVFIIEKRPSDLSAASVANMGALHDYANKKNIFYTTQGVIGDQDTNAIPLYKGWLKIPRGKQRIGLNDRLSWSILAQAGVDLTVCGMTIYKEYT